MRKVSISAGVSTVIVCSSNDLVNYSSGLEASVIPFLRFFLRSFSILCSLRKNFCACDRTCAVERVVTTS